MGDKGRCSSELGNELELAVVAPSPSRTAERLPLPPMLPKEALGQFPTIAAPLADFVPIGADDGEDVTEVGELLRTMRRSLAMTTESMRRAEDKAGRAVTAAYKRMKQPRVVKPQGRAAIGSKVAK